MPSSASTVVEPAATASGRRILLPLVMLSGFCGISYEILYGRLLGNLLGQQFIINASVLLTFLLGIGIGTLVAHRLVGYLWVVELGIGVYAAGMVLANPLIERTLYELLPGVATSLYACAGVSLLLLGIPAMLIGCSLPLFAAYLDKLRVSGVFSATYALYNLGAAATVLATEYALLRAVGLRLAVLTLASANVVVALGLLYLKRRGLEGPAIKPGGSPFSAGVLAALAVASVASAIFQLTSIKLAEFIFGPYNETFALVLATVLIGLFAGSLLCRRFGLTFDGALLIVLGGLVWLLAGLALAVKGYAGLYPLASKSYPVLVLLKVVLVQVLIGLPAIGFGAAIPALLGTYRNIARDSGQLLFCSSVANAAGFGLMAFVLHRHLDYGPMLLLIAGLTVVAILIRPGADRRRLRVAAGAAVAVALSYGLIWEETFLYLGHTSFHSTKELKRQQAKRVIAERFKGPQDVFALVWRNGNPYFFINGYISIPIAGDNALEKLVGSMSGMLSARLDKALVLGMGSGATAGSVGLLFEDTTVVEINPTVLENLHRLKQWNYDVENMPNVRVYNDDAIHFMRTTPERYSLILNTVTTPLYFSSSKLYTIEFLRDVKERLTPDGIYLTWIDGRIGDRGFDIILETLGRTFDDCWMYYLDPTYFLMTCSDSPIALRNYDQVVANERMFEDLGNDAGLDLRLLPYAVLSTRMKDLLADGRVPVNTLDFPALEFEMSRVPVYTNLNRLKKRLSERMDLDRLSAELGKAMDWRPEEFVLFSDLKLQEGTYLWYILRDVTDRQLGEVTLEEYEVTARNYVERLDTARGHYRMAKILMNWDRWEIAGEMFSRCLELDPEMGSSSSAYYYLGKSLQKTGRLAEAAEALSEAWRLREDPRVPIRISEVLLDLGENEEALVWLDRTRDRDAVDRAYLTGRAYAEMGDVALATESFELGLRLDPDDKRFVRALNRLSRREL